jgi:multiple sugar transport system permease protein
MGGEILSCALVAYGFARFRFPGREALFILLLATMLLPGIITMIPAFLIWRSLGRVDTFSPLTVGALFAWGPSYFFLLRQFFLTIPRENGRVDIYYGMADAAIGVARLDLPAQLDQP